jgi:hypothetical protein
MANLLFPIPLVTRALSIFIVKVEQLSPVPIIQPPLLDRRPCFSACVLMAISAMLNTSALHAHRGLAALEI